MARMSSNAEITRRDFGDRLQLTNWVLDSGATCHMTSEMSYFYRAHGWKRINRLKLHIGNFIIAKQTV